MHSTSLRRAPRVAQLMVGAAALVPAALLPASAHAAESVTPNACFYAIDGYWRTLDFRIAGTSTPGYVPPGGGFTLKNTAIAAAFPDWIAEYGFNLGYLNVGKNAIKSHVWLAINGKGSAQGTQVVAADVTAETTITASADGQKFVSATPLAVAVALPDTTWTAPEQDGASVEFSEGSPGQLPKVAGYGGAAAVQPVGSLFIRAELSSSIAFDLDCLPGTPTSDYKSYTRGAAPKFDLAWADPSAPATGISGPAVRSPLPTIRNTSLKLNAAKKISLKLENQGLITAHGQARVRTVGSYTLPGSTKKRRVTVSGWSSYELGSGDSISLPLAASKAAQTLLARRSPVSVVVETRAATGVTDASGNAKYGLPTSVTLKLKRR
ncbi:MAG: hypothetical protein QM679_12895 [Patulibacter sp.]